MGLGSFNIDFGGISIKNIVNNEINSVEVNSGLQKYEGSSPTTSSSNTSGNAGGVETLDLDAETSNTRNTNSYENSTNTQNVNVNSQGNNSNNSNVNPNTFENNTNSGSRSSNTNTGINTNNYQNNSNNFNTRNTSGSNNSSSSFTTSNTSTSSSGNQNGIDSTVSNPSGTKGMASDTDKGVTNPGVSDSTKDKTSSNVKTDNTSTSSGGGTRAPSNNMSGNNNAASPQGMNTNDFEFDKDTNSNQTDNSQNYTDIETSNREIDNSYENIEIVDLNSEEYNRLKAEIEEQYNFKINVCEEMLEITKDMLKDLEDKEGILNEIDNYLRYSVQPEYDYYKATYTDEDMQEKFGITQEEFLNMSLEEFLAYMTKYDPHLEAYSSALEEMTKSLVEGTDATTIDEFKEYKESLESDIAELNMTIDKLKYLQQNLDYNLLTLTKEYQEFQSEGLELDLNKVYEDAMVQGSTVSYTEYCYRNGDVNPLEFIKAIKELGIDSTTVYGYTGTNYEKVIELSEIAPDFEKTYNFLYETEGKKAADQYLEDVESDLNMLMGQKQAQEFLATLGDHDEEKILNHLKTTGKGLLDGMETWAEGAHHFGEGIASIFGYEPSDVYTVNEYETMFILQELQKEKYGWLDNNYELSQSTGNMLPSITLGILLTPGVGTATMGMTAGGNSYHGAKVEGYSNDKALFYGALTGVSEATLQKYIGKIPGLNEVKVTSLKTFAKNMMLESIEEGSQEWVDSLARTGIFGEDFDPIETWNNSKKSALYGALISGPFNGTNLAMNKYNINAINKRLNSGELLETQIQEFAQKYYPKETENMSTQKIVEEYSGEIVSLINAEQIKLQKPRTNIETSSPEASSTAPSTSSTPTAAAPVMDIENPDFNKYFRPPGDLNVESVNIIFNKVEDAINYALKQMQKEHQKTTEDMAIQQIQMVINTGDFNYMTTAGGARAILQRYSLNELANGLNNILRTHQTEVTELINEKAKEKFTNLWNVLHTGEQSNLDAITLLYKTLEKAYNNGNPYALKVVDLIIKIKTLYPNFSYKSFGYEGCYWLKSGKFIHMGTYALKFDNIGTIMHETGHSFFTLILKEKLPKNWTDIISRARVLSSNKIDFFDLQQAFYRKKEQWEQKSNEILLNKLAERNQTLVDYRLQLTNRYKAMFTNIPEMLREQLKKSGYTEGRINEILSEDIDPDKAAQIHIDSNKSAIEDELAKTNESDYIALSDIVDAVFEGREKDTNTKKIYTIYGHGEKYYDDYGFGTERDVAIFHEIIANYTQLKTTGKENHIKMIGQIFGQEFLDTLEQTFESFFTTPLEVTAFNNTLNSSVTETLSVASNDINSQLSTTQEKATQSMPTHIETNYELGEWTKKVLENTQVHEDFDKLLKDIRKIDNISEEEHTKIKLEIIDTLVSSGKIKNLSNPFIHSLSKDPVMFERLIDTSIDSVVNLTVKNLDNVPKLLIPTYQEISSKSFNKLFEHPEVKKCVTNLSVENYVEIIQIFKQKKIHKWIESKTLTEKLTNMSIEDFYKSMNKIGRISNTIETGIKSENSQVCYDFLDRIAKKYYTIDILTNDNILGTKGNINIIDNIHYYLSYAEQQEYKKVLDVFNQLNKTNETIKEEINKQVINNAEINIDNQLYILDSDIKEGDYYDITIEIDDKQKIITLRAWDSQRLSISSIVDDYLIDAFHGNLKIKKINENKVKNNLILTSEKGLKLGLNRVILNIDGKQIEKNIKIINESYDYDMSYLFPDATTTEVISITPIAPTLNQKVKSEKSVYEVKYRTNNEVYTIYMMSPKEFKDNPTLDIDHFVVSENIENIEIVSVTELNDLSLREKIKEKEKYITSQKLFSEQKYGGNQSDVRNIVNKKLTSNEEITLEEEQKYQLLSALSKKYFPNITDVEFLNIADAYSKSGCGYIAIANAFATYMEGQKNGLELFKEKIGFDLKSGDTNYNIDALAFDIWLDYWSSWNELNTVNAILELSNTGINNFSIAKVLDEYFSKREINVNIKINECTNLTNTHNELLSVLASNSEYYNILSTANFDLELLSTSDNTNIVDAATANSKTEGRLKKDVGGHAMLITDIDEKGNLIVSSWSKKYRFLDDSLEQHRLEGKSALTNIWGIRFSLDSLQQDIKKSVNEANIEQSSNQTYNAEESRTGLLRENYYINQQVPYIKNVIQTMNIKYNGIGLKLLEKYLMDGNIGHITRDNNCRSYISSLTKEDLTKALNIIIDDQKLHEKIEIPNNLKPWEAKNMYNTLYDTIISNSDYNEYMTYVNNCKQQGIPYFFNYQLLEIQNQLQQLLNQFSFQKKYFSLKTNYDIFKYFGNIGDTLFPQLISEVERMSSYSQTPISAQDLAKVKDINYLEYIFANPTQNLANYLNSMGYANNGINNWNKQSIINYLKSSQQGEFLSKLTVNEVLAIYEYTCGSGTILQYLTGTPIQNYFRIKDPYKLNCIIEGLDSAIKKFGGLKNNMILYRGDDFKKLSLWKGWNVSKPSDLLNYVGKVIPCETYMSTGVSEFGSFSGEVKWIIKAPIGTKGAYVNDISKYFSNNIEFEYIVNRGSKFRIDEVYMKNGIVYIKAKIVE